jgi:hypothetical protein
MFKIKLYLYWGSLFKNKFIDTKINIILFVELWLTDVFSLLLFFNSFLFLFLKFKRLKHKINKISDWNMKP